MKLPKNMKQNINFYYKYQLHPPPTHILCGTPLFKLPTTCFHYFFFSSAQKKFNTELNFYNISGH